MQDNDYEDMGKGRFNTENIMMGFVVCCIIYAISLVWYWKLPLYFNLVITIILGFSLYYQLMVWYRQTNFMMVGAEIEDRFINEYAYQVIKRGYSLRVIPNDSPDPKSDSTYKLKTDIPKNTKRYVKMVTLINVILCPAWNYREFEGEDDIWGDE